MTHTPPRSIAAKAWETSIVQALLRSSGMARTGYHAARQMNA
jgi:hypothetical protein